MLSNCERHLGLLYRSCFTLFIVLTFFFLPLRAVLVRFDHVKLPNKKNLYVFFEIHDRWSIHDKQQLDALSKILTLRAQRQLPAMHLMVEVPLLLAQERANGQKVTYSIINRVTHCPLIKAEDIEIRCASSVAEYLLNLSLPDLEVETRAAELFNAGSNWCTVGDVTVGNLLEELSSQKAEICSDLSRIAGVQELFLQKYEQLIEHEGELKKRLDECHALPDERIIELAKKLYHADDSFMQRVGLQKAISDCGSCMFDLHIVRKILLSPYHHCMLVVGNLHAEWLCEALERVGANYQATEGSEFKPLEGQSFDVVQSSLGLSL